MQVAKLETGNYKLLIVWTEKNLKLNKQAPLKILKTRSDEKHFSFFS
jgi:hypothetical protein